MNRQSLDRVVKREPAPKANKYGARKTVLHGITFDSQAESEYYLVLLSRKQAGEIKTFTRQPPFRLQDGFTKNSRKYRPIDYVADFEVVNLDGNVTVIDVKGKETETFKIKRKLFEERYPQLTLITMTKYRGEWMTTQEAAKLKRARKRQQKTFMEG